MPKQTVTKKIVVFVLSYILPFKLQFPYVSCVDVTPNSEES